MHVCQKMSFLRPPSLHQGEVGVPVRSSGPGSAAIVGAFAMAEEIERRRSEVA